jgi:hypothetical protein
VSKRHAAEAQFGSAFQNRQAMTASTTWAATQREAQRMCKAMLRQRRGKIQGRFCPAQLTLMLTAANDWNEPFLTNAAVVTNVCNHAFTSNSENIFT